jgi:hypothetical protein
MGGNNENKSESGALQKFLPVGEATDQISQSGISALGLHGVVL